MQVDKLLTTRKQYHHSGRQITTRLWCLLALFGLLAAALPPITHIVVPAQAQQTEQGILVIEIVDTKEKPLSNATVTILNSNAVEVGKKLVTNQRGEVQVAGLPVGEYSIQVEAENFDLLTEPGIQVIGGAIRRVSLQMNPKTTVSDVVVVNGKSDDLIKTHGEATAELNQELLKTAPLLTKEFDQAISIVPNVIRGTDGKPSIKGGRLNQSALLINNTDGTDPATGEYSPSIPLESIDNVQVFTNPYLPEYGKFTGGVTKVETKRGGEKLKFEFDDLFPEPRFRSGSLFGFANFSPRLHLEGPVIKNHFYFAQGFEFDIDKKPVRGLPSPDNEVIKRVFRSFTQLDFIVAANQTFTLTFNVAPREIKHVGLDFFNPQRVAPNQDASDVTLAAVDRVVLSNGSTVETIAQYKRVGSDIFGNKETDDMFFSPVGRDGNYYHTEHRITNRYQLALTDTLAPITNHGIHNVKMGVDFNYLSNSGTDRNRNVDITRTDGTLAQKITYYTVGSLQTSNAQAAAFVQDQWLIKRNLSFDYGLRFEAQRATAGFSLMPRLALAYSPVANGSTVFRASFGLFYDKVPLNALSFINAPRQMVTSYAADGRTIIDGPRAFVNQIAPRPDGQPNIGSDFAAPRNTTFSFEMDQRINPHTLLKIAYLDSNTQHDLYVSPVFTATQNTIMLFNNGRNKYRSLEITSDFQLPQGNTFSLSYVRSKARGETNDFGSYFGDFPDPILRPNQFANLPIDAPNRLLARGTFKLPSKVTIVPLLDLHTGFPYPIRDELQNYVGERNSARFPRFFSLDMAISKDIKLRDKYTAQFTLSLFNVTDHFNPRNVRANLADPQFGEFFASYRRFYRVDFSFIW